MSSLNKGQEKAVKALRKFVRNPDETMFALTGCAGTGKSYVINEFISTYETFIRLMDKTIPEHNLPKTIYITATTNKAVNALREMGVAVDGTIYSLLGLRPLNNHLVKRGKTKITNNSIVIIDEASMIDKELLGFIKEYNNIKFIFVGDPYQLLAVKNSVNIFNSVKGVELDEIMRQTTSNSINYILSLRDAIKNNTNIPNIPIGNNIKHLKEDEFYSFIRNRVTEGSFDKCKVITYTNEEVIKHNKELFELENNRKHFKKGDALINNKYCKIDQDTFKTDEEVVLTSDLIEECEFNINGYLRKGGIYEVNGSRQIVNLDNNHKWTASQFVLDLRPSYSCTIHKSQGSTYKDVFINLNHLKSIYYRQPKLFKRLLYVAISRASNNVYLTGDIE